MPQNIEVCDLLPQTAIASCLTAQTVSHIVEKQTDQAIRSMGFT